jgi:hypothetical protein
MVHTFSWLGYKPFNERFGDRAAINLTPDEPRARKLDQIYSYN